MRIPLSHGHSVDTLFSLYSKNGEYSVKSSYQTARQIRSAEEGCGECSMARSDDALWKLLWKLHIPSKIKVFAWRALHDILPTRVNLMRRKIVDDGTCQLCQRENETVLHVLWECSVAKDVWAGCSRELQKHVSGQNDLAFLFEELRQKLSVEVFELFVVQLWLIWSQRNAIIHGGVMQDPTKLGQRAREFVEEYRQAQIHLSIPTATLSSSHTWNPPPCRLFKLNFDAAVFNDIKASGIGDVIRNDLGEIMVSMSAKGPQVADSEEAEILACSRALEMAVDSGFSDLIVEGDNASVMKNIAGPCPRFSRFGHLYEDIHCLVSGLRSNSIQFVHREANRVAHSLARYARNLDDDLIWMEDIPPFVLEALYVDSS